MDDILERYVRHLTVRGLRPNTIAQAQRVIGWLERGIRKPAIDATPDEIEYYLAGRTHTPTRCVEWSYLNGFYRWALKYQAIDRNPMEWVPRPRRTRTKPRPMPWSSVQRILLRAPERTRPWFFLATYAGLRACDIAPLRAEHLHWRDGWLLVPETKGGHERAVPVPDVLREGLVGLPDEGWLFPRLDGKAGHVSPHLVSELCGRFLRDHDFPGTFHSLRHWYATESLRAAKGNLRVVQELLGHQSVTSTEIYTEICPDEMAAAVELLPVVGPSIDNVIPLARRGA